jgi:hypothetical protein
MNMKSSVVRSMMIFVAGAGSATVVAGLYPNEPITPGQFQERATVLLAEVEALGGYVGLAENGRVGIFTNVGACVFPPPPPKWPANFVNPSSLDLGLKALAQVNVAYLNEEPMPVYVIDKCRPYAQSMLK